MSENQNEELHERADAMAAEIERRIARNNELLEEFEDTPSRNRAVHGGLLNGF